MATSPHVDEEWDAGDLGCGELVLELKWRLDRMRPGQIIKLVALDPGAPADMPAWCRMTGHTLLHLEPPVYLIERRPEPWPTSSA
jgi:tRNA 2-thiouridine synthesizing protein A